MQIQHFLNISSTSIPFQTTRKPTKRIKQQMLLVENGTSISTIYHAYLHLDKNVSNIVINVWNYGILRIWKMYNPKHYMATVYSL